MTSDQATAAFIELTEWTRNLAEATSRDPGAQDLTKSLCGSLGFLRLARTHHDEVVRKMNRLDYTSPEWTAVLNAPHP